MDQSGPVAGTLEAPGFRVASPKIPTEPTWLYLQELQIRMSVVVYDRRRVVTLINLLERSAPGNHETLRAVLIAARRHLELSEKFEEAEVQARIAGLNSRQSTERLNPLLKQVYRSWQEWHVADGAYRSHLAHLNS
jgi:hypothetical protein